MLRGRTLYCIADLSGVSSAGSFRMDCEPGRAGAAAGVERPSAFTAQTATYKRAR
jgi:hypothetical protein